MDWITVSNRNGRELCDSEGLILVDIMLDFYMEQLITFPTRKDRKWIFLLPIELASNIKSPAKFSDHDAIGCLLACTTPLYSKANCDKIGVDMLQHKDNFFQSCPDDSSTEED